MFLFYFIFYGGALVFLGGAGAPASPSLAPPMSLAIVDTRSLSFDAPQKGEVITGQTARCLLRRLGCVVERSGTDISHTLSFYFPNVIELVQRIVRFVMRTEPKASSRTVQYEYTYRYTPNIYIYIYIQCPPLILAPLVNMSKGSCENKSALFILFIFH